MSLTGFTRPGYSAIEERVRSDINAGLPGADSRLRRSVLGVLAKVLAGLTHGLYGYLDWIARQAMPLYAEGGNLNAWGAVWGVTRKPAARAGGAVAFTGMDGGAIPAGAELRDGNGVAYTVTAGATISGGAATVAIMAAKAGAGGNQAAGVTLTLGAPSAGVAPAGAVVAGGLTGGADAEADGAPGSHDSATFRGRILDRIQAPPHGGAGFDYVTWALEVPGVTHAWVSPRELGDGTVTVRFMMHDTHPDGMPVGADSPAPTGDVAAVFDHIERLRPVTARLFVVKPVAAPLDVEIAGLSPDTPAVRDAIKADIADMLRRRAEPGATIRLSWIWEAVALAAGEDYHAIEAPTADVTHAPGQIATLGTIRFV